MGIFACIFYSKQCVCEVLPAGFSYYPRRVLLSPEATTKGVLLKKMFLEISQKSQENTFARDSFLLKLQA